MITAIAIFVAAYLLIASEKVDKAVVACLGAAAMVFTGAADFNFMLGKIDLNVFGLLIGMMIIVNLMGATGVFEWIAVMIAKMTRANAPLVVALFMVVTAVVSSLMDNVTTVILMAPATILICQLMRLPVVPVLILEAIFSNIGGTATLIGDPPNILIGSACGLSFNDFIAHLTPVTVVITLVCLAAVMALFRRRFKTRSSALRHVMLTEPAAAILDAPRLRRSLVVFALTLAGFFMAHHWHLEPGLIALAGAMVMTLVCRVDLHGLLEKVEWPTILFFSGLFMMVGGLEQNQVFERLGTSILALTGSDFTLTMVVVLWTAALVSAVVDNIPLVIAMIPLIMGILPAFVKAKFPEIDISAEDLQVLLSRGMVVETGGSGAAAVAHQLSNPEILNILTPDKLKTISETISRPLFWALALGACLGGNGTLIGATANVVVSQIARKNNYQLGFIAFARYGFPIMIASVALATVYLVWRYAPGG